VLLKPDQSKAIEALVAGVESRTGVQVVVAVVEKSDNYVELPWKAFALGASVASLAVVLLDVLRPQWVTADTALIHAVAILGTAASLALVAVFVRPFARLFLREARGHVEVKQHAQSLFLTRELFRTERRTAVLVFLSEFERRIEILPDVGLHGRIRDSDWRLVIDMMSPELRRVQPARAIEAGLRAIEELLVSKGFHRRAGAKDVLPDKPIEETGS